MEDVNPKGFWEHAEIVSIHDQLLEAFSSSWDDESPLPNQWWHSSLVADFRNRIVAILRRDFSKRPIWIIKDPRMCRLLPLWQDVFRELACQPLFVLALRNPVEVANSLRKRNDLVEVESCLLWLTCMLEAEYQTRGQPRAFVNYERLLSDWRGTVADIGQTFSLTWPVTLEVAATGVDAFLDPSLRHHAGNATLPDHPACRFAQEGFELLSAASLDYVKLDRLLAQTGELAGFVAPLSKRLRSLRTTVACLELEKAALHTEIQRIKSTVSWRITKPLRFVWNMLPRLLQSGSQSPYLNCSISTHVPDNTNEDEAYALLLKRFAPDYKDRVNGYIKGLLAIDHYSGRIDYLGKIIGSKRFHSGIRVLVSGYGAGSEMIAARQAGLGEIHGVEVDPIWVEVTRKRLESMTDVYPSHYDGRLLPYSDARFDMLLSGHVIEHTSDPKLYLHECMRVLATGGYLSLEFPHRYHHTELHTRLPSLEWLPRSMRDTALRVLSGRYSPLTAGVKERYARIVSTGLQQISMASVRNWLKSSGYPHTILDTTKAAPGITRCVVRKDAEVSAN